MFQHPKSRGNTYLENVLIRPRPLQSSRQIRIRCDYPTLRRCPRPRLPLENFRRLTPSVLGPFEITALRISTQRWSLTGPETFPITAMGRVAAAATSCTTG